MTSEVTEAEEAGTVSVVPALVLAEAPVGVTSGRLPGAYQFGVVLIGAASCA